MTTTKYYTSRFCFTKLSAQVVSHQVAASHGEVLLGSKMAVTQKLILQEVSTMVRIKYFARKIKFGDLIDAYLSSTYEETSGPFILEELSSHA